MRNILAISGIVVIVGALVWVLSPNQQATVSPSTDTDAVPKVMEKIKRPHGASVSLKAKNIHSFSGVVAIEDIPPGRFRDQVAALPLKAKEYVLQTLADAQIPRADVEALSVMDDGSLIYGCGPNCAHDHSKGGRP